MTDNKEMNNGNGPNGDGRPKRKSYGSIISAILIVAAALAIFIIINGRMSAQNAFTSAGWPAAGRGSCCSIGNLAGDSENQLAGNALDYYSSNYGNGEGLTAKVDDYGCHQEVTIFEKGIAVKRFGYSGGSFYDLTP